MIIKMIAKMKMMKMIISQFIVVEEGKKIEKIILVFYILTKVIKIIIIKELKECLEILVIQA